MIVLNKMFVGDYCLENIGHEIINMFRADNGHFYVYLNSTGDFARDKQGKVEYVLLTRNCPISNTVQIIGKAKVKREIYNPTNPLDQKKDPQVQGISYGGADIISLFNANTKDQNIYVTYEVDEIVEPENGLYISFDVPDASDVRKDVLFINKESKETPAVKMARASLKQYIDREEHSFAYTILHEAIDDKSLWKKSPVGKVDATEAAVKKDNFFRICRIENNELAYSNAFAYLFDRYRKQFCNFAKKELGVSLAENFRVFREKWNIDILIVDEHNVIVIENKVLSHINGLWFNRDADQEESQLKKYYEIVTGENEFNRPEKHFFIFAPDHNNIDLKNYLQGDSYKIKKYSTIRDYFVDVLAENDDFAQQLSEAMVPHTQTTFDFYTDMKQRFMYECRRNSLSKKK